MTFRSCHDGHWPNERTEILCTNQKIPHSGETEPLNVCGSNTNTKRLQKKGGPAHRQTPYSLRIGLTADHPTQRGCAPPQKTVLTVDLTHRRTAYSIWTYTTWNTLPTQQKNTFVKLHWEGKNDGIWQTDLATYRLNRPRDRFSENLYSDMYCNDSICLII